MVGGGSDCFGKQSPKLKLKAYYQKMDKLINEHFGDNVDLQTIPEIEERDSIA
jgi:hypothetical protein